jgi:hypothetical protein
VASAPWISAETAFAAKLAIALAAAIWLAVDAWLRRRGRGAWRRRGRDALLATLGVAGGLAWWNWLLVPVRGVVHEHDAFHYYVGARYFRELGYTQLYRCALAADLEAGLDPGPRLRDLETNRLLPATTQLDAARACKARFEPERWQAFARDLDWFRARLAPRDWQQIREDHGFNGSPVWLLAGGLAARAAGGASALPWLAALDPLLLLATWFGVTSAFGWRVAAIAAVFWGTNGFAGFDWTGGSLLRQDWLAALLLGIACLRRERPLLGGALLATSALLRVFPALLIAGVVAARALAALRARSMAPLRGLAPFAAGVALAVALLVPLATVQSGVAAWSGFAANSRKLLDTPLLNHMGLRPAVAFERESSARRMEQAGAAEPFERWKETQRARYAERAWILAALALVWLALFARGVSDLPDWAAAALAAGAIPIATQLTAYYHAALAALALLVALHPGAGIAMLLFAAATQGIAFSLPYSDLPFVAMSLAEIAAVFVVTGLVAGAEHPAAPGVTPSGR